MLASQVNSAPAWLDSLSLLNFALAPPTNHNQALRVAAFPKQHDEPRDR